MNRLLQEIFCADQSSGLCTDTRLQLRDVLALLHRREISEEEGEARFRYLIRDNTYVLNTFDEYISKSKSEKKASGVYMFQHMHFSSEKESVAEETEDNQSTSTSLYCSTEADNFYRMETIVQSLEEESLEVVNNTDQYFVASL